MIYEAEGRVIKGLGGLYNVRTFGYDKYLPAIVSCRAKGSLKREENKIFIGDRVRLCYDTELPDSLVISEILSRDNLLIRPPMANLSYLFITIAAKKPTPVLSVVDKLISVCAVNRIVPVVVITKNDLSGSSAEEYAQIYREAGISAFITSAESGEGVESLKSFIYDNIHSGSVAAFAGASGVGKSTLLNALFPSLELSTAGISEKIERGRHTTRHVELFPVREEEYPGFIADTPGFSLLDFARFDFLKLEQLESTFFDIERLKSGCRYADCTHINEGPSECAVARAVQNGELAPSRVESYRSLYKILKEKKNTY